MISVQFQALAQPPSVRADRAEKSGEGLGAALPPAASGSAPAALAPILRPMGCAHLATYPPQYPSRGCDSLRLLPVATHTDLST